MMTKITLMRMVRKKMSVLTAVGSSTGHQKSQGSVRIVRQQDLWAKQYLTGRRIVYELGEAAPLLKLKWTQWSIGWFESWPDLGYDSEYISLNWSIICV